MEIPDWWDENIELTRTRRRLFNNARITKLGPSWQDYSPSNNKNRLGPPIEEIEEPFEKVLKVPRRLLSYGNSFVSIRNLLPINKSR